MDVYVWLIVVGGALFATSCLLLHTINVAPPGYSRPAVIAVRWVAILAYLSLSIGGLWWLAHLIDEHAGSTSIATYLAIHAASGVIPTALLMGSFWLWRQWEPHHREGRAERAVAKEPRGGR